MHLATSTRQPSPRFMMSSVRRGRVAADLDRWAAALKLADLLARARHEAERAES
jgi:hypothetical protein